MRKLKEIFEFIREKLKNPRTRAATILGLYLIFFIFVFAGLRAGASNNSETDNETAIINYDNVQNNYIYKYNMEISTNEKNLKYLFTGTQKDEEQTQKIEVYNSDLNKYIETNEYEYINERLLSLENVINYVNNIESEFSTNYKDGTIQKNYLVPITKIDETLNNQNNIEINVYEKENFITKIIIDSKNLEQIYHKNILKAKYILEYTNL